MAYPFREILEETYFVLPMQNDVMIKTGPETYRFEKSEKEYSMDAEVMVEVLVSPNGYNIRHKIWEISLHEDISFEAAWSEFENGLRKK